MKIKEELTNVINFQEKKTEKNLKTITSEQKLKLVLLEVFYTDEEEKLKELFQQGLSIDEAFKAVAVTLFEEMKRIIR
ncbi:hypothetical protein [Priestia flexa]|uniref:hypothetical protein n=1 Tax=Priestia flexa TaxID=86664 RepID=UPI00077C1911|nr:hypothetical protein [Priestia flexa]MED4587670.1 hypothetical protein [Priestia flexa]